jgi:hypothetical protein
MASKSMCDCPVHPGRECGQLAHSEDARGTLLRRIDMTRMDEQARKDALADAETLDNVCWSVSGPAIALVNRDRAADSGLLAIEHMGNTCDPEMSPHQAYFAAVAAAHAAFRAVPGLRGE